MLFTALQHEAGPVAIRYPRGHAIGVPQSNSFSALAIGESEVLRSGERLAIWAVGAMVSRALQTAALLQSQLRLNAEVINARFVKPMDQTTLERLAANYELIITMEEGILKGGFGSEVVEHLMEQKHQGVEVIRCGLPDQFLPQGNRESLLDQAGLSPETVLQQVQQSLFFQTSHRAKRIRSLFRINRKSRSA